MKIAVTYENGQIFQHFGHTEQFKVYEAENGKIISENILFALGSGHSALAGFLALNGVDALICGGIGSGAKSALAEEGITLYCGVTGSTDDAVIAFLNGTLNFNPDIICSHHSHGHSEGHNCGSGNCKNH